jgi:hypothetical protein
MPGLVLVLLVICGFAVVGCGSADPEEELAIEERITATFKSRNPADCTRYLTQHYLEQMAKMSGAAAVTACEEEAVDPRSELPEKVTVSRVDVDEHSAIAVVSFEGSIYDGQTVRLALVERDGGWKLYEVLGFIGLDAEKLVTGVGRELMLELESPQEVEAGACIVGLLTEVSPQALEALVLDASLDRILSLADRCLSGAGSV